MLLRTEGLFVYVLVCYFSMKVITLHTKFDHVISHFLVLPEANTQCSSQEEIDLCPVVMNDCRFCFNNLCLPSCVPVYKAVTTVIT